MKLNKLLILMVIPLFLVSCSNPNTNNDENNIEENTTEDGERLPDDGIDWDDEIIFP